MSEYDSVWPMLSVDSLLYELPQVSKPAASIYQEALLGFGSKSHIALHYTLLSDRFDNSQLKSQATFSTPDIEIGRCQCSPDNTAGKDRPSALANPKA